MSQDDAHRLRYIEATRVQGSHVQLDGFELRTPAGKHLGNLDGFIVDPATRRVRSFVVRGPGFFRRRRYLVPLCPAQLDAEHQMLRVEPDDDEPSDFDPRAFETFSDDDAMAALFGPPTAA